MTALPRDTLYDAQAERIVIGSILIEPLAIETVNGLTADSFYLEACGLAFSAARRLHSRGLAIDHATLESELKTRNQWGQVGISFLSQCETETPSASNVKSYAEIVEGFARRRQIYDMSTRLVKAAMSDDGQLNIEIGMAGLILRTMTETTDATPDNPNRFLVHWGNEALKPQPPIEWIVEPLFSAGSVSLIVGEGGTKKTYSMIDLAVAVALGQPWLGFTTKKNLALIVDEESGNRRMAGRLADTLRGHDAGLDAPIGYISLACLNLYNDDDRAEFGAAVLGLGAKLVIVDALADVMPNGDENAVKDVQPIFHALRVLAEEAQCAIIVIHHSNKVGTYRGSTALKGAVDLMLMVSCDGDNVTFKTEKARDIEPVRFAALANFAPGMFNLSPAEAKEYQERIPPGEEYVARYLIAHPDSTVDDIKDNADTCSIIAARRALYKLAEKGQVVRTNTGGRGTAALYAWKG